MEVKKTGPKRKKYPSKDSHLFKADKNLSVIETISLAGNLTVIYLYNNNIAKIENLNRARNLKSLYLQKNKISKMENFNGLKNLKKLFLGHNEISVLEGLETLTTLEELHIEKQRLKDGDSLCFDPRSVFALTTSLRHLNVSHNNITSLSGLAPLRCILSVNASFNQLKNITDIGEVIRNWYYLQEAVFKGNPICKQRKYREALIADSFNLSLLDNKQINDITRKFIKLFEREKLNKSSRHTIDFTKSISGVAKNYPLSVQKAVSQSMFKGTTSNFDTTLQNDGSNIYTPWNSMPKTVPSIAKNFRIQQPTRSLKNSQNFVNIF